MRYIREHKKASIIVLCVLVFGLIASFTFARYIYNVVYDYILETKGFYFNSSILSVNNKTYRINNWDGVNNYPLTIDLNNRKNSLIKTDVDIAYDIRVECSSNVSCTLNKESGIVDIGDGVDSYTITVDPIVEFDENDVATVRTYATSTSPYKQTISATYIIGVVKKMFTYDIKDAPNEIFCTLNLTNSIAYYRVEEAFNGHRVGDVIDLDEYNSLSDANKDKCYSAKITVTFDPNKLYLDMTANAYLNRIGSVTTTRINNYNYVSSFTFKVGATTSEKIIFYKANRTLDYTYPIVNETSIIDVDMDLVE